MIFEQGSSGSSDPMHFFERLTDVMFMQNTFSAFWMVWIGGWIHLGLGQTPPTLLADPTDIILFSKFVSDDFINIYSITLNQCPPPELSSSSMAWHIGYVSIDWHPLGCYGAFDNDIQSDGTQLITLNAWGSTPQDCKDSCDTGQNSAAQSPYQVYGIYEGTFCMCGKTYGSYVFLINHVDTGFELAITIICTVSPPLCEPVGGETCKCDWDCQGQSEDMEIMECGGIGGNDPYNQQGLVSLYIIRREPITLTLYSNTFTAVGDALYTKDIFFPVFDTVRGFDSEFTNFNALGDSPELNIADSDNTQHTVTAVTILSKKQSPLHFWNHHYWIVEFALEFDNPALGATTEVANEISNSISVICHQKLFDYLDGAYQKFADYVKFYIF